jgi:chromosome segregation ATPase
MRALTRAFRETEAKYKVEAEETAKDLLRLTGELNKRDKAYRQLKQFCEEQEVLKDTMKAQQQAELQRNHERRVNALKLVETTEHEKVKVVDELERIKVINGTIKDEARDAQVRHTAELDESNASFERQTVVLNECQTEVGRLDAECKQLTLQYNENNVVMQTLTAENEACENARLAAVAELRTSELCREQEAEAHQKRLADLTQQTEEILSLKAQLKTSNSNAEYMEQRADRLERALSESNSERGMLRQKMKQADIENNQLTKRVQLQHNQRVELSVQLATTRSEVETSNNRYEEALSDLAVSKQSWKELDGMNTELQARSERLASEGVSLRDAAETLQARVEELESENVILMTNLNDVEARLKKCRKIEDLTQMLDIGNLMKSNLAVAQTLDTFMKIVPSKTSE